MKFKYVLGMLAPIFLASGCASTCHQVAGSDYERVAVFQSNHVPMLRQIEKVDAQIIEANKLARTNIRNTNQYETYERAYDDYVVKRSALIKRINSGFKRQLLDSDMSDCSPAVHSCASGDATRIIFLDEREALSKSALDVYKAGDANPGAFNPLAAIAVVGGVVEVGMKGWQLTKDACYADQNNNLQRQKSTNNFAEPPAKLDRTEIKALNRS